MPEGTTPGRRTTLMLDIDDYILTEESFAQTRMGAEIAKSSVLGTADSGNHTNVSFANKPGCWALDVLQTEIANVQEYKSLVGAIIGLIHMNAALLGDGSTALAVENWFRQYQDLPGMVY
ncbi:MAG TPA: hypothetical protein VKU00_30560, partial [Chthonomonadaceae bacterium]|nr:hypothetical protein [Chthonomonadaceae bacterium]